MSNRYRFIWSRFSRVTTSFRSIPTIAIHTKSRNPKLMQPCLLGFSLFTWLGFEKKLNAEDELIHTIKHCILFIQKNEFEKAEQLLHVALRQAQQIHHQLGITYIYDVMANLALQREQLDKAKQLFVTVTQRIMSNGAQEDDPRVVHLSVKLARISHLKKDYSTAQLGYDWCLEKLHSLVSRDPTNFHAIKLLAMAEDWYGRLYLDVDRCEEGLKLMKFSLERMREVPDIEKEHLVVQMNDIGTVCDRLGQTEESIRYFNEAIEMGKSLEMDLGTMYVNLGRAYMKTQLLDAARKSCGYAWKLGVMSKNNDVKQEAELCIKQINNLI